MTYSTDPDQMASSETNWSGSTILQRQGKYGFSRTMIKVRGNILRLSEGSRALFMYVEG